MTSPNGVVLRDSRSASSTIHDRHKKANTTSGNASASSIPNRKHPSHHRAGSESNRSSTPSNTAKDTFLNYFFGGQGPASGPSSAIPSHMRGQGPIRSSDAYGDDRLADQDMGKVAAMDMKSLDKHIESVCL